MSALWLILIAPSAKAELLPWFARWTGSATQVISVVGIGSSRANMDIYQHTGIAWKLIAIKIPAHIGIKGMTPQARDGYPATPMGIFSLPYAFGTAPSPGGRLPYVRVNEHYWWDGDPNSKTFNTMQICQPQQCGFKTSESENLKIPQYKHAVVMGVNPQRIPGHGSGFFLHTTDGHATAGCVAINDHQLIQVIQWLRPGALIAISQ